MESRRALSPGRPEANRRFQGVRTLAAVCALFAFPAVCLAETARPAAAFCDRSALAGRGYIECLETALRKIDSDLAETNAKAQAQIEARNDLAITQRTRWKNVIEEAHSLFVRFRNFECQNVAPYEGGNRIGAFEERLACLLEKNVARVRELQRRYGIQ